jgi:hypothetical protein
MFGHLSPCAAPLKEVIYTLCITNQHTLMIGGSKFEISLWPPFPSNVSDKEQIIMQIATNNARNYQRSQVKIIQDITIPTQLLSHPKYIYRMAQGLPHCRGIFTNLATGRESPTLTCILDNNTEVCNITPSNLITPLLEFVQNDFTTTPLPTPPHATTNPPTFPSPPRQQGRGRGCSATTTTSYTKTTTPMVVSTTTSTLKYHILPNPAEGIAKA